MNTYDLKKQQKCSMLQLEPCLTGTTKEKLNVLEQKEDTEDSSVQMSSQKQQIIKKNKKKKEEEKYAIVESLLEAKKTIWRDKLNISEKNFLITELSKIMDQESTSKEKDSKQFWTSQSKDISQKLWLPTKTDCVDSVLNSLKESSQSTPMGKSWFSIKKKHPQKKNSLMTSFQSSQYSPLGSMAYKVTPLKNKSKTKPKSKSKKPKQHFKTLKFRIFPTEKEKEKLKTIMEQYRWYYNASVTTFYDYIGHKNILKEEKYPSWKARDILCKYNYVEEYCGNISFKEFVRNDENKEFPIPYWWAEDGLINKRTIRGATYKFISALNSAISNYNNGNITKFSMRFRTRKNPTDYVFYEDPGYPAFIRKIKSRYWYTTRDRKRKFISVKTIDAKRRSIEVIHEKETDEWFLHYPVEVNWFPEDDRRNDNQIKFETEEERVISLDPGIRKFLVGYDPQGNSIYIGEKANLKLLDLLYEIDKTENSYLLWKKAKNLVSELHWKTVSFLVENYDVIFMPHFRTANMLKSKSLGKATKRAMCMFSFHSFKEKLKFKCQMYKKKLYFVDEHYTSCTCGVCGFVNKKSTAETFSCKFCSFKIDRDVMASRNILIRNVKLK